MTRCFAADEARRHLAQANSRFALGQYAAAADGYTAAIALDPSAFGVYNNLGVVRRRRVRFTEATRLFRHALTLNPAYAGAAGNLGNALLSIGAADQAIVAFEKALVLEPDNESFLRNYILSLNLSEHAGLADLLDVTQRWHKRFSSSVAMPQFVNERSAERRLRIGYLSGRMFRSHTTSKALMPVISHHHPEAVEVFIYSDLPPEREDHISQRFARHARWRRTGSLSDQDLAKIIRGDQIDVLVDITGFFSDSRMKALAARPAPVQVAFPVLQTSGGTSLDYVIADSCLIPAGHEKYFAERVERVPCGYCFDPLIEAPEPSPSPAVAKGYVTFGSMNSLNKISNAAIRVWARILEAVPNSRLLIKAYSLLDPELPQFLQHRFGEYGVSPWRIELWRWVPNETDHLAVYHEIDVALDSFPYGGVTTTCESLWMGVPVVTMIGDRVVSRYGLSILTAAGLEEGIARSEDEYVMRATALAANIGRLSDVRRSLRQRIVESPPCDGEAAAQAIEGAYRRMWRRWCANC